jgi:hypothetical protein
MSGVGASAVQTLAVRRLNDAAPITANTVLANDDTLFWSTNPGEVWLCQGILLVTATAIAEDCKLAFVGPAGASAAWGLASPGNAAAAAAFGGVDTATTPPNVTALGSSIAVGTPASGQIGVYLTGVFVTSTTGGTFNLQAAQNTSNAGALTINANSVLLLTKLA